MKLSAIQKAVTDVTTLSEVDNESAHVMEDKLYLAVLRAIANSDYKTKVEMVEAAAEVLKAANLKYRRWYA